MAKLIGVTLTVIRLEYSTKLPHYCRTVIFKDWYEFADYLREEELSGNVVAIYSWEYIGDRN